MITIYLGGTVTATEYRRYFKTQFKDNSEITIIDPIEESNELLKQFNITETDVSTGKVILTDVLKIRIVEKDKLAIDKCNLLIALVEKFTAGTLMEIMYAHIKNIPILIINPGLTFRNDVWLWYHSFKFFDTMEQCSKYVLANLKSEIF